MGEERLVEHALELLEQQGGRLGLHGGSGKSTLARELYARVERQRRYARRCFVEVNPVKTERSMEEVQRQLLVALTGNRNARVSSAAQVRAPAAAVIDIA